MIVLTTSQNSREVERCYELGCNMFLTKPIDYERFKEAIAGLGFFLSIVQVPQHVSDEIR